MLGVIVRIAQIEDMPALRDLRMEVFVHEQAVPEELEMDDYDDEAIHAIALVNGDVVATGRLILSSQGEARIGRMAVKASMRRQGIGSRVFELLEREAQRQGAKVITLHAQAYVTAFYEQLGYTAEGLPFEEAGIDHVMMRKSLMA